MAGPLRPNPPHPLELNGRWKVGMLEKSSFFLKGPAPNPPPVLMALPLRDELFIGHFR